MLRSDAWQVIWQQVIAVADSQKEQRRYSNLQGRGTETPKKNLTVITSDDTKGSFILENEKYP